MIDFPEIRDYIIAGVKEFVGINFVMADQNIPKPAYPHMGYKAMVPYGQQTPLPTEDFNAVESTDSNFTYDVQYQRQEQIELTISFTAYSDKPDEAEKYALMALYWFNFNGYEYLKDKGVIVVETTNVQNRDTLIVNNYERRKGFDAHLRILNTLERIVPTIETVDIERAT